MGFQVRVLGIEYESEKGLSFEPGNVCSPRVAVSGVLEAEWGIKVDQGLTQDLVFNVGPQKVGAEYHAAVKFPTGYDGKALGGKILADASAGWDTTALHVGQVDVGYGPDDGWGAACGFHLKSNRFRADKEHESVHAFLEASKDRFGPEHPDAVLRSIKPVLEHGHLAKLATCKVLEGSTLETGSGLVLGAPTRKFGDHDEEGFSLFALHPKLEEHPHLHEVAVGRRYGKDPRAKLVVEGKDEEANVKFRLVVHLESEGKLSDEEFKAINEKLASL